jgi:predicted O-methyltransferase YrrM
MQTQEINFMERAFAAGAQKLDDNYALGLLHPLLIGYPFIPLTRSSLRPFCIAHILNDIVIHNRRNIIEFGSGLSTIMIGRLIRKNDLNTSILSIEHDQDWANVLCGLLQKEKLDDLVKVVHAPLRECTLSVDDNLWYDTNEVSNHTKNKKFDMVIIDGPPAWIKGYGRARYPALPFIIEKLSAGCSVYLDDVNRAGEQSILELWQQQHAVEFNITGETLGYYRRGNSFDTEPLKF